MRDLDRALADISLIRSHLVAGAQFQGFGPLVMALTGAIALLTAAAQSIWPQALAADHPTHLAVWVGAAALSGALIGAEMFARCRRRHHGLADAMLIQAAETFAPSAVAGAVIALALYRYAPQTLWLAPGLWQILIALGLFAAARILPRAVSLAAAWYFVAGVGALILASQSPEPAPWLMGAPVAVGQFLLAAILRLAEADAPSGGDDGQA